MNRSLATLLGTVATAGLMAMAVPALADPMAKNAMASESMTPTSVEVGGAPMMSDARIPENASKAKNLTTLVAAVTAAGLVDTLNGDGPFTVFAPTNTAFEKLPAGTVDTLLNPEMKPQLTGLLTYHVVAGKMTAADLAAAAKANGGTAELTTVAGGKLMVMEQDGHWVVKDEMGGVAMIETADVLQANGVVHVVDSVLMPKPASKPM